MQNFKIGENRTPLQMVEQLKNVLKPDRLKRSDRKRAWKMIREFEAVKVFRPGGGMPALWLQADLFCSIAQFMRFRDGAGNRWQEKQPRQAPMPSRRTLLRERRRARRKKERRLHPDQIIRQIRYLIENR